MLGIFLDQETTGLDSYRHHLLEIAFKIVCLETGDEKASFQSVVAQSQEAWQAHDPTSIAINGFCWQEIERGTSIPSIRSQIISLFQQMPIVRGKAVFICQNPSFDRAFFSHVVDSYTQEKLNWPYHWLDLASMYWALEVKKTWAAGKSLPEEVWLSKDTIAKNVNLEKEQKPHRAMQGVEHLLMCYEKVVGFSTEKVRICQP